MPPAKETSTPKSLPDVVQSIGVYPIEAYEFVQRGLNFTVQRVHGKPAGNKQCLHVSGQDLCHGLRDFAHMQWGMLARTVLARWNVTSTLDFGRLVFAMIEHGLMQKTDQDAIDDFKNVYEFKSAFDHHYRIEAKP